MPAGIVYRQVRALLDGHLSEAVEESTRERLTLLVLGIVGSESASPARIAGALRKLGLSGAGVESIERRVRRIENDPQLTAGLCFHPLARARLLQGRAEELFLVIDPTSQQDRVMMLSVSVWYRGRALPLAWAVWPANTPLEGAGFWERVESLLEEVAPLLPVGVPVTWLADRAFGTPAFTDLIAARHWSFVVRVQGQTRCRDGRGLEGEMRRLVRLPGQRAKLRGQVFKKRGWRSARLAVFWGRRQPEPLCLVSNTAAGWTPIHLYRRRFSIEATFRDYKSHGWHWEAGQVIDLNHIQRLLVGMALATWLTLCAGTQVAAELLARPAPGRRRTLPWSARRSLFRLGLQRMHELLNAGDTAPLQLELSHWTAPNWQRQIYAHHARAFVFAPDPRKAAVSKILQAHLHPVRP